jgi:hypothetical protein
MVDDTEEKVVAPAEERPADETPTEAPTDQQPEGEQPEGEQAEAPATDEPVGEVESDDEDEGETAQEKKSRLQRYREQTERLRAENEQLRARTQTELPSDVQQLQRAFEMRVRDEIGDPPNPNDPRYKDDYVSYSIDRQAWVNDQRQVTRQVRREFAQAIQQEQERVANLVSDHRERVEAFKKKAADYNEVMAKATMPVAPHVERLLLQSKKSEQLSYVLAKNQLQLARLNRMDTESAAREIGRLEGRLSTPAQSKQQTQARKPITPLKGSGAAPASPAATVNNYLKKLYGNRA